MTEKMLARLFILAVAAAVPIALAALAAGAGVR